MLPIVGKLVAVHAWRRSRASNKTNVFTSPYGPGPLVLEIYRSSEVASYSRVSQPHCRIPDFVHPLVLEWPASHHYHLPSAPSSQNLSYQYALIFYVIDCFPLRARRFTDLGHCASRLCYSLAASLNLLSQWQTTWDRQKLFTRIANGLPVNFTIPGPAGQADIVVDDTQVFQTMDRFGATLSAGLHGRLLPKFRSLAI